MKYIFKHKFFAECACGNRIQMNVNRFDSSEQEVCCGEPKCYICNRPFKKIICLTESAESVIKDTQKEPPQARNHVFAPDGTFIGYVPCGSTYSFPTDLTLAEIAKWQ